MAGFAVAQGTGNDNWQAQLLAAHPGDNAAPVPFLDAVKRSYEDTVKTRNSEAVRNNYGRRVSDMDRQYRAITGKDMVMGWATGDASGRVSGDEQVSDADYDAWVLEQRAADQRLGFLKTTGELRQDVTRELMPVRQAADAGAAQHPIGSFVGGLGGSLADLDSDLMMAGSARVGIEGAGLRIIATRIGLQGALGAGQAAALTPGKMSDAQRFGGPDYTQADAAGDIVGGALGGAAVEGLGIGLHRLGSHLWRTRVAPRLAAGADVDPAVRGAVRQLELSDIDDQAAGAAAMPGERDHTGHALTIGADRPNIEPEKNLGEIFEKSADAVPEYQSVANAYHSLSPVRNDAGMAATDYQGRTIWSGQFDPMTLDTDAVKFQYKADGDREGVTARLQGVQAWDPASSGKSLIWEDAGGRQFVADGHQRRGLARRLVEQGFEQKPMLDGYLFREAEGWSARDVRIIAALKNMREGSGTILDAAKVFRDAPGSAADRSLPVTGDFIQQARALARLEPEAFGAVVNKVIPERYAAEIGQVAGNRPDMHMAMVRLMKEAEPSSIDEARALVSEALLDEQIASEGIQADLFGGIAPQMTTIARAKVKASVLGQLRRDARIYTQLVKNADIIEAGGNALARTENERRLSLDLAAAEIVNRLSLRSGPVGEAFAEAARKVAEGARAGDVSKGITASVKKAIADGEIEQLAREALITPEAPPPAIELDPHAQIAAKPEDAAIEGIEENQGGLFDDILSDPANDDKPFAAAMKHLTACAPGGA